MTKIAAALKEIVHENPFLEFGLSHRLCNLSQLAKFLEPLVEIRTQKEVSSAAITMALSRLQKTQSCRRKRMEAFSIQEMRIYRNLATQSFTKTRENIQAIHKIQDACQEIGLYFVLSEGAIEATFIFDREARATVNRYMKELSLYRNDHISCISVRFDEKFIWVPGHLYSILQKLNFQNINLVEVSSTYTEFNLYLEDKDIQRAFETLQSCFKVSLG